MDTFSGLPRDPVPDNHPLEDPVSAIIKGGGDDDAPLVLEIDLPADIMAHPAARSRHIAAQEDELRCGGDLLEAVKLNVIDVLAWSVGTLPWLPHQDKLTSLHQLMAVS